MQSLIEKAAVLIEALPYIQKFRGETVIVKFGGSIMDDKPGCKNVLKDIAFMACVGLRPVVVHGGGKAISRRMKEMGITPEFIEGLRVTDEQSISIVEKVLNQETNPEIVSILNAFGCKARGIHGEDIYEVKKYTKDSSSGSSPDWGFVGDIIGVDIEPVQAYLHSQIVPVITPLSRGPNQMIYNTNADQAAAAIAEKLKARKLVFLSNIPGLLNNPSDPQSLISTLRLNAVEGLIKEEVIGGGMLPKIDGAIKALNAGVRKTHIVDAALSHSLLLELFTDAGVGTEILP